MEVYTRMSGDDASDYDKLKEALLTRYNFTEHKRRDSEEIQGGQTRD